MSRSKYRGKRNKDWWGKRPLANYPVSNKSKVDKFFKRMLHKIERKQGEKITEDDLKSYDNTYLLCGRCLIEVKGDVCPQCGNNELIIDKRF